MQDGLTGTENNFSERLYIISEVKNILVVRQHNQIGDMLCSLTLYAALKKKHPNCRITLVAAKTNYEIPFFDINPFLDRVIIFDKSSFGAILSFLKNLRSNKYQIGLVPSTIKLSRTSHLINFIAGSKKRVGVKSIDGKLNKSHIYLNIKDDFNWRGVHQTERNLEIARLIGCDLSKSEIDEIGFKFSTLNTSSAENFISENFPDKTRKIIAFHPGAGKIANTWPFEKFISLIKLIFDKYNNYVLLTSGLTDETIINKITTELNLSDINYTILHNLPVKDLGAILKGIDLYITNDTGTMHIAGYSDAKMISLFGPTDPDEWAPNGKNKYFIKSGSGNINDISVSEVFELARKMLNDENR